MKRILFLCSRNRLRSPTAEYLFAGRDGIEVASAGLSSDAEEVVSSELIEWADMIFVMEKRHRAKLASQFGRYLKEKRIICLDIPDDYGYMEPALVEILERRVGRHLGLSSGR